VRQTLASRRSLPKSRHGDWNNRPELNAAVHFRVQGISREVDGGYANCGCNALQAECRIPGYVEQALAGGDPKLIL
jgi:hypothetical protein